MERQAGESRARAAELAGKTAQLQKDIEAERQEVTEAAASVRAAEEALSQLEKERAGIGGRLSEATTSLSAERARLAELTAGLVRVARTPPESLLLRPGAPVDIARGEILLQAALTAVRERTRLLHDKMDVLGRIGRQLDDKKAETERAAADLKSRQDALALLVERRQALYRQTDADRKTEEARATKVAAEAADLRDLMGKIEAERAEDEARRKAAARAAPPARAGTRPQPPTGDAPLGGVMPVAGRVKTHYGQADGVGVKARGVTLATRPGATVTAPAAGTVRFAGPFRGYREILILEHSGAYHSLIAGMTRIDVAVGASVGAGEPVGTMDDRPDAKPELYYELRRDGQSVDPEAAVPPVGVKGKAR